MSITESAKLAIELFGLRAIDKPDVGRRFEDMQLSRHTRRSKRTVHADCVRKEQVARAALKEGGWEAFGEIAEQW